MNNLINNLLVLLFIIIFLASCIGDTKTSELVMETIEEIDPVRYISNESSGKQGYEVALALKKLVEEGKGAGILFVCQRADAISFRPMWERDPKLANAVLKANNAGVKIWCITLNVSETDMTFNKEIPVNLELQNI